MTREERGLAIGFFKLRRRIFCDNHLKNCPKNSNEYIATLIEKSFYDMAIKALEQEECEDCISRKEALKLFEDRFIELQKVHQKDKQYGVNWCINTLKDLPSVNPQKSKIGYWKPFDLTFGRNYYYCTSCEYATNMETVFKYCPNCGAKMVEPKESEGQNDSENRIRNESIR